MKKVLKWVLISIAIVLAIPLLLLVLLLLCFPIRYRVLAKIDENKNIRVNISYLLGLVRYKVLVEYGEYETCLWILFLRFRNKAKQKKSQDSNGKISGNFLFMLKNDKKTPIDEASKPNKALTNLKDILTFGEIKTIIKDSFKAVKKILAALCPKFIDIEGEFGRPDPADTAILYGGYEAVSRIMGIRKNVRLLPVFQNEAEVLRLKVDVRGSVNVYRLIFPVAKLLLTMPIRDVILKGDSDEQCK